MTVPAGPKLKQSYSDDPARALEQLMDEYGQTVLRSAYFYTGDRHLAEDISQETFLRAYRSWTKFRGDSSVRTWLIKITVNVCRDKLGLKMSSEQPTDPTELQGGRTFHTETEALNRLTQSEILKYVLELEMPYQEVLYMYYYLDLTTREIAEACGMPEGTVRGRLHRARVRLSRLIDKEALHDGTT